MPSHRHRRRVLLVFRIRHGERSLIALQIDPLESAAAVPLTIFPFFVFLHCQIRLDVFLPQVGLCERVSPRDGEKSSTRFVLLPMLGAGNFSATILYSGSAFSFRFSSWNMYNVYNRSFVSKVGNLPGRSTPVLAGLTFLSRCFFPFRLLPRLRDFI